MLNVAKELANNDLLLRPGKVVSAAVLVESQIVEGDEGLRVSFERILPYDQALVADVGNRIFATSRTRSTFQATRKLSSVTNQSLAATFFSPRLTK